MINFGNETISDLVVTSVMGLGGDGDLDYLRWMPSYRATANLIRETGTTVIPKWTTRHPFKGNYRWYAPQRTVKEIQRNGLSGLINAYGMTNPGVEVSARKNKRAIEKGFQVIPEYTDDFNQDFEIIRRNAEESTCFYREILGKKFWALVIGGCPNMIPSTIDKMLKFIRVVRREHNGVVIYKYGSCDSIEFLRYLEHNRLVDMLIGTNTFHHRLLFPEEISPLTNYGGGSYSGEIIYSPGLKLNRSILSQINLPMSVGGGISRLEHLNAYRHLLTSELPNPPKQRSVNICSIISTNPAEANLIIQSIAETKL